MNRILQKLTVWVVKAEIVTLLAVILVFSTLQTARAHEDISPAELVSNSSNLAEMAIVRWVKNTCQVQLIEYDTLIDRIRTDGDQIAVSLAGMMVLIGGLYIYLNQATNGQVSRAKPSKEKNMFCPQCQCEYVRWITKCPSCTVDLVEVLPLRDKAAEINISYTTLVDLVKKKGGQLKVDLLTTDVGKEKDWGFPYQGYGFAWAKMIQGYCDDFSVYLITTEFGKESKWTFPFQGYGFAWARKMRGNIGGNDVILTTTKVGMDKKWIFPYQGYGFGWTEKMSGDCGDRLKIDFLTTEVGRDQKWMFPYIGYGMGWSKKSVLTITLKEDSGSKDLSPFEEFRRKFIKAHEKKK
ncbi:hypothetical protein ACFL02_00570 [Planctomycetota bacterium]